MKKIILLLVVLISLTGCKNIKDVSHDQILQTININKNSANTFRNGYKFYVPRDVKIIKSKKFNDVLFDGNRTYYLYVDAISYKNKTKKIYNSKNNIYYSKSISYKDKFGYLEINNIENDKYLIEIMYNYAKIEVIVDKEYINKALLTSVNILKSVEFNDDVIKNLYGDDIYNFTEEEYNIFDTKSDNNDYIRIDEDYIEEKETTIDTDYVK